MGHRQPLRHLDDIMAGETRPAETPFPAGLRLAIRGYLFEDLDPRSRPLDAAAGGCRPPAR